MGALGGPVTRRVVDASSAVGLDAVISAGCVNTCWRAASVSVIAVFRCCTCLRVAETINTDYLSTVLASAGSATNTGTCAITDESAALRIFSIFIDAGCIITFFLAGTLAIIVNGTIFEEFAVVLNQTSLGDAFITTAERVSNLNTVWSADCCHLGRRYDRGFGR